MEFACFYVISMFSHNFAEFGTGLYKGTNTAYFGQVQATVLCVYMISPQNT